MSVGEIILIIVLHNLFGLIICAAAHGESYGFEFCNLLWIYKNYSVNIFGTIVLALVYNLLCPIGTIGYWIYKLCTFGRR